MKLKKLSHFINHDTAKGADKITDRTSLKEALILAMQLEFSTIPPYLCAQWSVAPDTEAGMIIRQVLVEEMHHFGLVGNILYAIGGEVDLLNPQFLPQYPTNMLPGGIDLEMMVDTLPLSKHQLKVFMKIESPAFTPVDERMRLMTAQGTYKHIGDFYKVIIDALKNEEIELTFNPEAQQIPIYGFMGENEKIKKISSRKDAIAAIELIMEEGEGSEFDPEQPPESAGAKHELAHYYSFKEIHEERRLIKKGRKWVYEGEKVLLPKVLPFEKRGSDKAFSKVLEELMKTLQYCWTHDPGAYKHSKEIMLEMEKIGRALISNGKCPIFSYLPEQPVRKEEVQ
jgi:hypothetical protein